MPADDDDTRELREDNVGTRELTHVTPRKTRGAPLALLAIPLCVVCVLFGYAIGTRRRVPSHAPKPARPQAEPGPPTPATRWPAARIASVAAKGEPTRVVVTFAEPVESTSAVRRTSYSIDHGVKVLGATLGDDPRTVDLTTSPLTADTRYTLTVRGVRLTPRPAVQQAAFQYSRRQRVRQGLVVLYDLEEAEGTTVKDASGVGKPLHLTVRKPEAVTWIPGGLAVRAATIIASAGPAPKLLEACKPANAVTIEAWLKAANTTQAGPARIVTLSTDPLHRLLTLGQQQTAYNVRLRTTSAGVNGDSPSLSAPDLVQPKLTHVVYTRDTTGVARIYIDGVVRATATILGDLGNWDSPMPFALANELTFDRPWLGELHLVALYARALSPAEVAQNHKAGPGGKTPKP